MKLAVCVKQVGSLDDEFELRDGAIEDDDVERELNEWDAVSLEMALRLREAAGEGEVAVLTVGDEDSEEALLDCMARGADRGLRIWSPELAGADPLRIAAVLAAALERESPDLVLCGVQSSDSANGATGAAVAGRLDMPRVAVVKQVEYDPESGAATVRRELEGGTVEVLTLRSPALLTIQTGSCQPRYANLRAIRQAREKPLAVCSLADLGLEAATLPAGSRQRALRLPESGPGAQMLAGPPAELAAEIKRIVAERVAR